MMIDRRLFREVDWILLGLVLVNTLIGIVFIYSSSHFLPQPYYVRQMAFLGFSLLVLFFVVGVDYKFFVSYSPVLYGLITVVLAASLVFARLVAGTKSWIRLGIVQVQPSELAKIVMILFFARLFAEYKQRYLSLRFLVTALLLAALPLILIILQPDLGTALTFLAVVGGALLLAGMKRKTLVLVLVGVVLVGAAGWNFGLKDYQKKRLTTLIDPQQDPRGSGYQIRQSKIAIGSGGAFGKGFKKGTQSQLRFLPARHTDFIFSVIGEEFGFAGVLVVVILYSLMLARMFLAVGSARDRAGVYVVFLSASLIAFQFLINILMIIGLFPVTGVPIPFLSYGGSSLVSNFMAVGLVLNVRMRRFANV